MIKIRALTHHFRQAFKGMPLTPGGLVLPFKARLASRTGIQGVSEGKRSVLSGVLNKIF